MNWSTFCKRKPAEEGEGRKQVNIELARETKQEKKEIKKMLKEEVEKARAQQNTQLNQFPPFFAGYQSNICNSL